jgi:hypothetical protein
METRHEADIVPKRMLDPVSFAKATELVDEFVDH